MQPPVTPGIQQQQQQSGQQGSHSIPSNNIQQPMIIPIFFSPQPAGPSMNNTPMQQMPLQMSMGQQMQGMFSIPGSNPNQQPMFALFPMQHQFTPPTPLPPLLIPAQIQQQPQQEQSQTQQTTQQQIASIMTSTQASTIPSAPQQQNNKIQVPNLPAKLPQIINSNTTSVTTQMQLPQKPPLQTISRSTSVSKDGEQGNTKQDSGQVAQSSESIISTPQQSPEKGKKKKKDKRVTQKF
ncbi:MAG: hypothetical protein EZS28_025835 [Streblomastix strix]|uniref:Uncharacterized protein n=1 Tax=Streblomastix strix TaxID=222440 RepID=A0A5J4V746_9EUKA|nr:MAG: hypothetical protein EZS28_025835 [Streblomastix strix]